MKVLLNNFHLNGPTESTGLEVRLKHLVQHNKQYRMKVLLNSFNLNTYGHTLGIYNNSSPKVCLRE